MKIADEIKEQIKTMPYLKKIEFCLEHPSLRLISDYSKKGSIIEFSDSSKMVLCPKIKLYSGLPVWGEVG